MGISDELGVTFKFWVEKGLHGLLLLLLLRLFYFSARVEDNSRGTAR